jgi:hypothetical protein
VPGGSGALGMISDSSGRALVREPEADDDDDDDDDADDDAAAEDGSDAQGARKRPALQKYTGVSIQVKFAHGGDTQSIQQLSGGQKTMVALCLIFAIQRCDAARPRRAREAAARGGCGVRAAWSWWTPAAPRAPAALAGPASLTARPAASPLRARPRRTRGHACPRTCPPRTRARRCDPAPFYLFDEIDANLDASHRDAVARMVHGQSNKAQGGTQFISTTFRCARPTAPARAVSAVGALAPWARPLTLTRPRVAPSSRPSPRGAAPSSCRARSTTWA